MKQKPAILVLADGTIFRGWSLSFPFTISGEVVFTTGITGYQEIITDPSYSSQIVIFTSPEIGNTGINDKDNESFSVSCAGIITRNLCEYPNNWRMNRTLPDCIKQEKIPILYGLDTRKLTQHLRSAGAMNGCLSNQTLNPEILQQQLQKTPSMVGLDLVSQVTISKPYEWNENILPQWQFSNTQNITNINSRNIVVLDCGVKYNILRHLANFGGNVIVLPANSSVEKILSYNPIGLLLSNGPGDPSAVTYLIQTLRSLFEKKIPIFGICMGHQIIALALGYKTFKLKFGHRGINHPTGVFQKVDITSQNHGFAVSSQSLINNQVLVTHYNLNDYTVAGLVHKSLPIFSVQYHPEASPGPHDTNSFFQIFYKMIQLNLT